MVGTRVNLFRRAQAFQMTGVVWDADVLSRGREKSGHKPSRGCCFLDAREAPDHPTRDNQFGRFSPLAVDSAAPQVMITSRPMDFQEKQRAFGD
jgi:hypothetical protein